MVPVELLVLAGIAVAVGMPVVASRTAERDDNSHPDVELAHWQRVNAEVISTLRAGNRTFLRVRFSVGTSLIQTDVQFPLAGAVPHPGRQVPIRYDPAAPARVTFDVRPSAGRPPHA
jgi:hypothetical protein